MMRVGLITLGCDKNTVDNEYIGGMLEDAGCEVVPLADFDPGTDFDAVVINTCGFIADAKLESLSAIVSLAEKKATTGNPKRLYVRGCLGQRYAADLLTEFPDIDGIVGVGQFDDLVALILDGKAANKVAVAPEADSTVNRFIRRKPLSNKPYAFLKIADGCNHACAFCAIPRMKGPLRSTAPEFLLDEARALLANGARELNLIAQDITVYGQDRSDGCNLPRLLRELAALEGDFWIRCLYCYPAGITDELMDIIAGEPKIVPYLDIPFQHFDADVLRKMKRPDAGLDAVALVARLRERIPGVTLRTTMLVGFPGESPQAHRRTVEMIERLRFDRLGAFQYSKEEGTAAAEIPRQVAKRTIDKRWHTIMAVQADISDELNQQRIGQTVRVLIDEFDEERHAYVGRSAAEAPEVDGVIFIQSPEPLDIGEFITVKISGAETYDLYGNL